ncbi:MAG: ABC transporter ATP-binding protein [Anaerolineales bacterium]|nr:ABC transporter ATP-binding protein [Anaerolineales bacterium]
MKNSMVSGSAICCRSLSRHFGEVIALNTLDLDVPAGSIFGFLGRNGAGKTTAMRLMTGLAFPTSGKAWIAGIETTSGDNGSRTAFGYLPQEPAFYGWMTAIEFLDYVGRIFGMEAARRKQRITELLDMTGLQEASRRKISGYSGGMKQRLGIAQAMLHEPPVLILDEPTSALDPAGRAELLDLLVGLRGRVTVFFSSHILADVDRICDHIAVLHRGELLEVSAREDLLARNATDAVEIQFEGGSTDEKTDFLAELNRQPWIDNAVEISGTFRILVSDRNLAAVRLPALTVKSGMVLKSYSWVQPSLEEVFLEMSG